MHATLVLVHAVAAVLALVLGVMSWRRPGLLRGHTLALAGMAGVLPFSLALAWPTLAAATSAVFVALTVLAMVMVVRGVLAERAQRSGRRLAVLGHVGFNVISLVVGFLVLVVLRAGGGAVGVTVTAVVIPVLGSVLLRRFGHVESHRARPAEQRPVG